MNRTIKFRAWDIENKIMVDWKDIRLMPLYSFEKKDNEGNPRDYILMQFTGLHDKNGKEIYEGDIVKDAWIGIIIWEEDGWFIDPIPTNRFIQRLSSGNDLVEVIGNIYQNKDLIN